MVVTVRLDLKEKDRPRSTPWIDSSLSYSTYGKAKKIAVRLRKNPHANNAGIIWVEQANRPIILQLKGVFPAQAGRQSVVR